MTDVRRLMTIPGIDVITASTLVAVIGDVRRFPTSRHLVGYLGLHPTIRQSGSGPARHGRVSKEGSAAARHVLVEAAWSAAKAPGPLRAFAQRTAARRGRHVATVAVARKLAVLAWHLLTRAQDYAFQRPSLVRRKLRALELAGRRTARQAGTQCQPGLEHRRRGRREAPRAAGRDRVSPPRSLTGKPWDRRWVRARHRSAHLKGPRRARPRGRPTAPDACTSPRQSPTPATQNPTKEPGPPPKFDFHP